MLLCEEAEHLNMQNIDKQNTNQIHDVFFVVDSSQPHSGRVLDTQFSPINVENNMLDMCLPVLNYRYYLLSEYLFLAKP